MQKNLIMFVLILLLGCNRDRAKQVNPNDIKIDSSLVKILDEYIKVYPIDVNYGENLNNFYAKGYAHPSYHIYFNKKQEDTTVTIVLFPQLHPFEIENFNTNSKGETIVFTLHPKGFFVYKDKNPIIIFDKKSIANKFYNKEILHSISDTLIATNIDDIKDYKGEKWRFLIKNGEITEKITKKEE